MSKKYHTSFFIQKIYNNTAKEAQIRMRVRWDGNVVQINSGFTVSPSKWCNGEVAKNTINKDGYSRREINDYLSSMCERVDSLFASTRGKYDRFPTIDEVKNAFRNIEDKSPLKSFFKEYLASRSTMLTDSTIMSIDKVISQLFEFDPDIHLNSFTTEKCEEYIRYLLGRGYRNTVAIQRWVVISTFLKFCKRKYNMQELGWEAFKPNLKTIKPQIIFLSWDELMKVYNVPRDKNNKKLCDTWDIFMFACFTGLRYSDLMALTWNSIHEDAVVVNTIKDKDFLIIPHTKYTREILGHRNKGERVFDYIPNGTLTRYIKKICQDAGLNTPIKCSYMAKNQRIEYTKQKYELISIHSARKSFICNALEMGISVTTLMKITGHSSYDAMKPYINVTNEAKKEAMKLFDER